MCVKLLVKLFWGRNYNTQKNCFRFYAILLHLRFINHCRNTMPLMSLAFVAFYCMALCGILSFHSHITSCNAILCLMNYKKLLNLRTPVGTFVAHPRQCISREKRVMVIKIKHFSSFSLNLKFHAIMDCHK